MAVNTSERDRGRRLKVQLTLQLLGRASAGRALPPERASEIASRGQSTLKSVHLGVHRSLHGGCERRSMVCDEEGLSVRGQIDRHASSLQRLARWASRERTRSSGRTIIPRRHDLAAFDDARSVT